MATVRFLALDRTWDIEVPVGTSLLEASKKAHAWEGDACGGVCACSTCHVYVKQGKELLSEAFDVQATSRLGCQARIVKDGALECEITRESLDAFFNEHPQEQDPRKKR
jgi:ferredoxin, 2Fe-2S